MNKGCVIFFGIALMCILAVGYLLWDSARIKDWGVGVESVEWLPKQASNITFISGGVQRGAEFDIDRDSFAAWCDSIGKPLSPVTEGQPAAVWRVNRVLDRLGIIRNGPLKVDSTPESDFDRDCKRFTTGDLFYEHRWSNGGGYAIGYDVSDGRGYYDYSRR